MTETSNGTDVEVSRHVGDIAARMSERVAVVSSTIRAVLEDEIPELRGDTRTIELLGASVGGNVDTILHALRHDIAVDRIVAPTAALEYARRLAQHGVPVNALVRAYRLGQRRLTEMVFTELRATAMTETTRIAVIETFTSTMFAYIDRVSQQVVAVYEGERERWLENQNSIRALRVRELLAGSKEIDLEAATAAIRYPLRWHHVALVMWYRDVGTDSDELTRLQKFLRELALGVGSDASGLFATADRTSGWAWLPFKSAPIEIEKTIRDFVRTHADPPGIAIGAVGSGIDGFRRSHRQAQRARTVGVTRGTERVTVVASNDPGLSAAALFGASVAEVREWVAEVLGPLADDTLNDERLRETLRIFLRTGSSYKAAAAELDLHANSVKYRVGRAVARRGAEIGDDRLDVELALLVCHWYGSTVLHPSA